MAFKYREEIVGKRFLSVRSAGKLKVSKLSEWDWRAGVIRAATHKDSTNQDISVLVEFDDAHWQRREWIRVFDIFQVFLVENTLLWAPRPDLKDSANPERILWPALNFKALVDKVGLGQSRIKPVEFFLDHLLQFHEDSELCAYTKEDDPTIATKAKENSELRKVVRRWLEYQDGQSILLTTPSVLVGYRVEVYRAEGTTQWYTAVIQSYNENTRELSVTDDTVLEAHNEDPALVQMKLIGDGVVESILKGENIGITPRRRTCNVRNATAIDAGRYSTPRIRSQSPNPTKLSSKGTKNKGIKTIAESPGEKEKPSVNETVLPSKTKGQVAKERKRKNEEETTEILKKPSGPAKRIKPGLSIEQNKLTDRIEVRQYDQAQLNLLRNNQPTVVVKPLPDNTSRLIQEEKSRSLDSCRNHKNSKDRTIISSSLSYNTSRTSSPVAAAVISNRNSPASAGRGRTSSPISAATNLRSSRNSSPVVGRSSRTCSPVTSPIRGRNASPASSRGSRTSSPVAAIKGKTAAEKEREGPRKRSDDKRIAKSSTSNTPVKSPTPNKPAVRSSLRKDSPAAKTSPQASQSSSVPAATPAAAVSSPSQVTKERCSLRSRVRTRTSTPTAVAVKGQESNSGVSCISSQETRISDIQTGSSRSSKTSLSSKSEDSAATQSGDKLVVVKSGEKSGGVVVETVSGSASGGGEDKCKASSSPTKQEEEAQSKSNSGDNKKKSGGKCERKNTAASKVKVTSSGGGDFVDSKPAEKVVDEVSGKSDGGSRHLRKSNTSSSSSSLSSNHGRTASAGPSDSLESSREPSGASADDQKQPQQQQTVVAPSLPSASTAAAATSLASVVKSSSPSPSLSSTSSRSQVRHSPSLLAYKHKEDDSNKMHPKKMHLLDSLQKKESNSAHESFTSESGINVNHSLTDQIAKLSSVKAETIGSNWNNNVADSIAHSQETYNGSDSKDIVFQRHQHQSSDSYRHSSHKNMDSSGEHERSVSRGSSRTTPDDRRPSSSSSAHTPRNEMRFDHMSNSPLVLDRREPFYVWRDPELLKQDELKLIQQQQQAVAALQQQHSGRASVPPHCSAYPGVHSIPSTAHHSSLLAASSASLLYRPLSMGMPMNHLPTATPLTTQGLVGFMPHHLLPTTPGSQNQPVIPPSYATLHSNLQTAQLELLWQHKYPTVPVPPPWMLNQYQDELLRDVNPVAVEREKLIERERLERERMQRAERERVERERAERDRVERERKEKEERERAERDRKEREEKDRKRREEQERLDKERALKESAKAAVDQHFNESLRLASQKGLAPSNWSALPSITRGYPKPLNLTTERPPSASSTSSSSSTSATRMSAFTPHRPDHQDVRKEEKDTHGATDLRTTEDKRQLTLHQEHMLRQQFLKDQEALQGRPVVASPPQVDTKPHVYPLGVGGQPIKQEPSFNIYGYQPYHHTYITQDKLRAIKDEKRVVTKEEPQHNSPPMLSRPTAQRPGEHMSNKSSVIKENKLTLMPAAAHSGSGSIMQGTSISPRSGKEGLPPGHYPAPPVAHSGQPPVAMSRTQSPLGVASPQQLSAAVMQPMELHKPAKPGTAPSGSRPPYPEHAKPGMPLTVTTHMVHQQGHPNPVYSQAGKAPMVQTSPGQTFPRGPVLDQRDAHSPAHPGKRRSPQPHDGRGKKPKLDNLSPNSNSNPLPVSSANPHPGLVGGGANQGSFMDSFRSFVENTVHCAFFQDQQENNKQKQQQQQNPHQQVAKTWRPGGGPQQQQPQQQQQPSPSNSAAAAAASASSVVPTQSGPSSAPSQTVSGPVVTTQSNPVTSSSPALSTTPQPMMLSGIHRPTPTNTPGGASISSTCSSITDTINRVANGFDTDSDTLSAPSPPSHVKSDSNASPCSKVNHTKFKKAWLLRYSDDNKDKEVKYPPSLQQEQQASQSHQQQNQQQQQSGTQQQPPPEKNVKKCYVNCSYISPTKEGGRKSPIASIKKDGVTTNSNSGKEDMEATSSASEAESQQEKDQETTVKKKVKNKRQRQTKEENSGKESPTANSKKSKNSPQVEKEEEAPPPPAKKRLTRKKDNKEKKGAAPSTDDIMRERKEEEEKNKLIQRAKEANPPPKLTSDSEIKMERKQRTRKNNAKEETKNEKDNKKKEEKKVTRVEKGKKKEEKEENKNEKKPEAKKDDGETTDSGEEDEPRPRSKSPSQLLASKPLNKEPVNRLKKTMAPFLQDASCSECTPKLSKCRECKMTPNQRNKKQANIFCRFYAFRRLRYNQKSALTIAGFSEPSDAEADEIELWMPRTPVMIPRIDVKMAKYLITNVGDQFCELVEQEKEAMSWVSPDTQVAWKRAVQGVREMCDVCYTTLFNMHWVCHRCGFVVCIDCYRQRTKKSGGCKDHRCTTCETDGQKWLTCSMNRQQHEPEKLMLTQIIPSDALWVVGRMIHDIREKWRIRANCPCGQSKMDSLLHPKNGVNQIITTISDDKKQVNGVGEEVYKHLSNGSPVGNISPLTLLADVASLDSENKLPGKKNLMKMKALQEKLGSTGLEEGEDGDKNTANCSTLRELLTKTTGTPKSGSPDNKKGKPMHSTLDDIIQQVVERNVAKDGEPASLTLKHYIPRSGSSMQGRESPIPCYTLTETSVMFPDVPHSWLDNGRLLRLHDPHHKGNLKLFQQQWRRAQPVMVSGVNRLLNRQLWMPATFSKEFGGVENDLVNCRTGVVIIGHEMAEFWDGFEIMSNRIKDERGRPMILKLKDWPPTEDFNDLQPKRFEDLMGALPLPEYTHRTGVCNLASRLPDFFVKPDLGPKMYNAYGSALYPKEGTTNLHLDISDAVNVMVYVGIPTDDIYDHKEAALEAIDKVGCCMLTRQRVREQEERPGAIWHIFDPHDADKIRDLLNKVATERGEEIEPHHDPIHDQSWYLDENLRVRLKEEYNVLGYTIVQCLGDAVFVPAGAPHQVRNLHSCIKIAEDFVSPENLRFCFKLTQEFRHLSDTHSNHEDKLQVKNIIYHVVKDAVAVLKESDP